MKLDRKDPGSAEQRLGEIVGDLHGNFLIEAFLSLRGRNMLTYIIRMSFSYGWGLELKRVMHTLFLGQDAEEEAIWLGAQVGPNNNVA